MFKTFCVYVAVVMSLSAVSCDQSENANNKNNLNNVNNSNNLNNTNNTNNVNNTNNSTVFRIVAFGDIHGDINALKQVLRLAGIIDGEDNWIAENTIVVQTGDIMDRGDYDYEVIQLLEKLRPEATAFNSELVTLCGNHEIMNLTGDFRYVTELADQTFVSQEGATREELFAQGGEYALILANYPLVHIIDGNVFVHGGVSPDHVAVGLDTINQNAREWALGVTDFIMPEVVSGTSVVWMRDYSDNPTAAACDMLDETLELLSAKRMIVGHTVQNDINTSCGMKVIKIDIGMSAYYGGSVIQALEIVGDEWNIISN
jgi:Calcineurin-like phosphoesterase